MVHDWIEEEQVAEEKEEEDDDEEEEEDEEIIKSFLQTNGVVTSVDNGEMAWNATISMWHWDNSRPNDS